MVSASPDAHPDQAGEGSARAPRLDGPRPEKRRGRRAGLRWAAGAALSSLSGPGGCAAAPHPPPRRLRPRPAPGLHWSGGCASGGAARDPDLRRLRTFFLHSFDGCQTACCFSPPPFSFISFSCSFLPPFLFPGGGCARLRHKLASNAKTKVERTARPSRSPAPPPPGSSFLCAPARTGPGTGRRGKLSPASYYIPADSRPRTPLPAARDQVALSPGLRRGFSRSGREHARRSGL